MQVRKIKSAVDVPYCTQRQIKHTADLSVTGHVHAVSTPPLACFFCHSPIAAALSSPHGWKIKTWSLDGRAPVALVDTVTKPHLTDAFGSRFRISRCDQEREREPGEYNRVFLPFPFSECGCWMKMCDRQF